MLKPTIIDGAWVYAPAPPQDQAWLCRQSDASKPLLRKEDENVTTRASR